MKYLKFLGVHTLSQLKHCEGINLKGQNWLDNFIEEDVLSESSLLIVFSVEIKYISPLIFPEKMTFQKTSCIMNEKNDILDL